jgi:predicted transglutaminase-like cysteine proteinase
MRTGFILRLPSRRTVGGVCALAAAGFSSPAQAALELHKPAEMRDAATGCTIAAQPLAPASAPLTAATKAAAMLGGAPSALDAIRAQQAAFVPAADTAPALLASAPVSLASLTPGVDASVAPSVSCTGLIASRAVPQPGTIAPFAASADPEHFLASKRVRIGFTTFDKDWKRVRGETLSPGQLKRHVGVLPEDRGDALAAVNRWVNKRIRYAEDRDQYGVGDFWAGARKTLRTGKGDCEDIALVKMQLLAAAGIPRDDMILTIARDLVRNADHAVLIVRTDEGYRMLDNATDEVLDAAPGHDYRPILSFGNQTRWLHGV